MLVALAGIAALAAGGPSFGVYDRYSPRQNRRLTLDEEEEASVQRMMRRAAAERRRTERERRQAAERLAERRAAEKEAARPKSRQELRARERAIQKQGSRETPPMKLGRVVGKDKSLALQRMLGKRKRRDYSL